MNALFIALLCAAAAAGAAPRTLRVDYFHSGNAKSELFSLDRVALEPLPWPGNPGKPADDSGLGKYRFEVYDPATRRVLYSRGFCSIFGEWELTDEAARTNRTFSESLRLPMPEKAVRVRLQKRDPQNAWTQIWDFPLDPQDKFVDLAAPPVPGELLTLEKNGDPGEKIDLLILGDGYTAAQRGKFEKDARRMMAILFAQSPFKERRKDFNIWALCPAARESGISRPSLGRHRRSPLGATYDAFDSERYVLTFENRAWRDIAAFAPYDFVEMLVNEETYGGGGIFGLYSTVAADNSFAPYIAVHELAHHIAGLADEYYTSDVAYQTGAPRAEPWEQNVSADPEHPKWAARLTPGVPVPTPWKKYEFEKFSYAIQAERRAIRAAKKPESEMDALFNREKAHESELLGQDAYAGKVGVFEGAAYEATGYYRSQNDCIMFSRDEVPFCAACQAALSRVFDLYSRR